MRSVRYPAALLALSLAACATPPPEPPQAPPPPPILSAAPPPRPPAETADDELRRKPPAVGKQVLIQIPPIREERAGSIRVLVAERMALPLTTVQLIFRWGQGAAPGVRRVWLQKFLDDATPEAPAGVRATLLREGIQIAQGERPGGGVISLSLDPESLTRVLGLVVGALKRPDMKGTTAASGETQSTTRFVNHTKQLASRIRDLRLPPGHPLQEGQGDAPTRPTPEELKKFHLSQIAPSILTVVVSGGVTAAAAREAVTGSLGSWSTGAVVKPPPPLPATKPLWIMEQEAPRSGAQVLFSMPGLSRPDLPPVAGELLLADFLQQLGAQMGDNGVQLDHGSPPDTDHLDFLVRTAVGGTADKISLVRAQLEAYNRRDRQVTLGLVARNLREQEWGRFIEQIGTTQGLANLMTGLVLADRPLDDLARTARLLQAESQDSPLVIDGALPADQLHTTILGKLAKERPGLARQKLGLPEARAFPRARSR